MRLLRPQHHPAIGRWPTSPVTGYVALALPLGPDERFEVLRAAARLARQDGDLVSALDWLEEAASIARDDGRTGRTVAQVMERAADGLHSREVELAAAHEAVHRAYQALERDRLALEERVTERTRKLAEEISVRRGAEERAIRASNAKSRFLENMSHELRTPLNAIIGYAELIAETADAVQLDDLDAITRSGRHLLRLVDRVLELTRLDSGTERVVIAPVSLDGFLDMLAAEAEPALRARTNQLARDGGTLGSWPTDVSHLRTILRHLLANAARYTERGTITLGGERSGRSVQLWVADTGQGIAPERLVRLFEPFEPQSGGGVGLGLASCRQLASVLGGRISAQSSPGHGARFVLTLIHPDEGAPDGA